MDFMVVLLQIEKKALGIQNGSCCMFTRYKFCIHNTGKLIMFPRVSEQEQQLTKGRNCSRSKNERKIGARAGFLKFSDAGASLLGTKPEPWQIWPALKPEYILNVYFLLKN